MHLTNKQKHQQKGQKYQWLFFLLRRFNDWRMERKAASVSKTHHRYITAAAGLINMYSDIFYGNVD